VTQDIPATDIHLAAPHFQAATYQSWCFEFRAANVITVSYGQVYIQAYQLSFGSIWPDVLL